MDSTQGNVAGIVVMVGLLWVAHRWIDTGRPPRLARAVAARYAALRRRYRPAPEPMPPVLFGLELRRMSQEVRRVEAGNQPSKAERLAACTLAYDLVLRDYCRSVALPVPEGSGALSGRQRFDMESALISAGHDW